MKRVYKLWFVIRFAAIIGVIVGAFWYVERPVFQGTGDVAFYFVSRLLMAVLIHVGSERVYELDERNVYRGMLAKVVNEEFHRREKLPDIFELLAAQSVLTFDLAWARDYLLRSPILYSRLINVKTEVEDLKSSYYNFVHRYTYTLLRALKTYNPEVTVPFIAAYAYSVDLFFKELSEIASTPTLRLSTRRRQILDAFFVFYDSMLHEISKMEERLNDGSH